MGFWNGRVTFTRYRVSGESPLPFGDELLERINQHLIGVHGSAASADQCRHGMGRRRSRARPEHRRSPRTSSTMRFTWRSGSTPTRFRPLSCALTRRSRSTPSPRETRAASRPRPSEQEAKEIALKRAEAEAADGRFRRLNHYPVLWDGRTNTLYAGRTSSSVLERLLALFRETFDRELEPITAGSIAQALSADPTGDAGLLAASFESGRFTTGGDAGESGLDPRLVR